MKWQYKVVALTGDGTPEGTLNKLGAQGWDLVAVTSAFLYLKRPAPVRVVKT